MRIGNKVRLLLPDNEQWQRRHNAALCEPIGPHELAIVGMLFGWIEYAEMHMARYESEIGHDYVLGPAWADIGQSLLTLLNGETGRLDCGTLDRVIRNFMADNGCTVEP